jgi:SAM-dependent methyltransferase
VGYADSALSRTPEQLPPADLAGRVGRADLFEELGRLARADIVEVLPEGWSFAGKRVLDFGCGPGRVLRQFLPEAEVAEFLACDIHAESVAWVDRTMSPPVQRIFRCDESPPLPLEDTSLDLILAISVFTHLAGDWSAWLLEMHRLLRPGGLLLATFLGAGMSKPLIDEPWKEDRIGMNVLRYGQSFDLGGPIVFHSPWWIREHWGRAFEIVTLREAGFARPDNRAADHGFVLMRKRDVQPTREDLEQLSLDEPREVFALQHSIRQLHGESKLLCDELAELRAAVSAYEASKSWRLTWPLRKAHSLVPSLRRK